MTANQIAYYRAAEERRHNLAGEGLTARQIQEQKEQFYSGLSETVRHNTVSEQETGRHNFASEQIQFMTAQAQQSQAAAALRQASVAERNATTNEKLVGAQYLRGLTPLQNWILSGVATSTSGKFPSPARIAGASGVASVLSNVAKGINNIWMIPNALLDRAFIAPENSENNKERKS